MLSFEIYVCILISPSLVVSRAYVDDKILESLQTSSTTAVIVEFEETNEHRALRLRKRRNRLADDNYDRLVKNLQRAAADVQRSALDLIAGRSRNVNGRSVEYRAFTLWARNELSIENADQWLVEELSETRRVRRILADVAIPSQRRIPEAVGRQTFDLRRRDWPSRMIKANQVWNKGVNGNRVILGVVDSGVHLAHDLLRTKWRKEYGWFDTTPDQTEFPIDEAWDSHGTIMAGLMVGGNPDYNVGAIGMAPGAKFIACRSDKNASDLTMARLRKCIQFMTCPTDWRGLNPNCSMRPHIVNYSLTAYVAPENEFEMYQLAGITVTYAAGNYGPNCSDLNRESELLWPITVGAVQENRIRPSWSSVGPTKRPDNRIKPDVMAPGVNIFVCQNKNSIANPSWGLFNTADGTSLSAAITAGVAALMLEANPVLKPEQIKTILQQTADFNVITRLSCGGLSIRTRPNYVVGWGIVNALKAYEAALRVPCDLSGG